MNIKRTCAIVDLEAITHNMEEIKNNIEKETQIIAVIKTDAYGHGAVKLAEMFENYSYIWGYAVATADEALELRKNNIKKPILILGYVFPEDYDELIMNDVRLCVYDLDSAKLISKEAQRLGKAANIHIKTDTGMSRIGFQVNEESADIIKEISTLPNIVTEGLFTHFSKADEFDKTFMKQQIDNYKKMCKMLEEKGVEIKLKHCSNSAAIIEDKSINFNLVRAGIIIYGLWPSDEVNKNVLSLKPAMSLKSSIIHIKKLPKGRIISYGGTYETKKEETIATVSIGYGDGYPRSLSNKGYVLVNGQKAKIVGRICMDQMMIDITDLKDVKLYDTVTLLGNDKNETITMEELGELSGRFNYEFACNLGKRIPRIYI
ncbi:alanine racemase [Acetitomaculum ruminis DSM 5522]|uniref:Alanine racemase n=1 Tax=Acetitomaculum ruminis DSM 5522 TaxID=1120918 RepID=A0A1I0V8B1_9FIRM|nr:alanine racemase [Acetitomaculum ruminis]SFA72280.1 alanine racemase [Acetitomaculum ruminis DSM 5522]